MDRTPVIYKFWTLVLAVVVSGCASLNRDPRSGYADSEGSTYRATDYYQEKQEYEIDQVREEFGWASDRALNENEQAALEVRLRLRRAESRLESSREKRQYYQIKSLMRNDSERLTFLSIPSVEARERWARNRGLTTNDEVHSDEIADMIEKNDISVGMSQKAVLESWGDPDLVEVAGSPVYGNERWRYSRFTSSSDGYQKENRIVYFESGRVVGWETH